MDRGSTKRAGKLQAALLLSCTESIKCMVGAGRRCQTAFHRPGSLLGKGREHTQLDRVNRLSARALPLQDNMSIIIKLGGTTTLLRYRYAY